jgi:uncharacterized protein
LILQGIRQVGKTWSLKEFREKFAGNKAYFNFEEFPELRKFFAEIEDARKIMGNFSLVHSKENEARKMLIKPYIFSIPALYQVYANRLQSR